jgi:hypothetical protein
VNRIVLVAALAACQQSHDAPPPAPAAPPAPVSTPAPAATPAPPRTPAPPLPATLPGKRRALDAGKATRAAIADHQLVLVDGEAMRVVDHTGKELARAPVTGGIEVLVASGHDVYAGWGQSREHMDAKARVTRHRLDHGTLREEVVLAPTTTRQDVVAIIPGKDLLVAYFESKYMVKKVVVKDGAETDPVTIRMATAWAVGPMGTVVGRLYGDAKGVDGDAFILAPDGSHKPLPTTRGVQGLAIIGNDIFVGDGWHQNYADRAQGLLTWLRPEGGAYKSQLIEDTPGQFTIFQIVAADLDGDGSPELITRGSAYVRVYKRTGDQWKGTTIGGAATDIAVGDLDGTGNEIVILGDHPEVVDLHGASL